jgi:hypothetical protein
MGKSGKGKKRVVESRSPTPRNSTPRSCSPYMSAESSHAREAALPLIDDTDPDFLHDDSTHDAHWSRFVGRFMREGEESKLQEVSHKVDETLLATRVLSEQVLNPGLSTTNRVFLFYFILFYFILFYYFFSLLLLSSSFFFLLLLPHHHPPFHSPAPQLLHYIHLS